MTVTPPFGAASRDQWVALALKSAGIGDLRELTTRTLDGIAIEPLYSGGDAPDPVPISGFPTSPPAIRPLVAAPTPAAASAAIRDEIAGGASEILLQIEAPGMAGVRVRRASDFERIFKGTDLGGLAIHLRHASRGRTHHAGHLRALYDSRGTPADGRRGGFGFDPLGAAASGALAMRSGSSEREVRRGAALVLAGIGGVPAYGAFRASGVPYHEAGASEAQELAALLATATAYLRACDGCGVAPEHAAPRIELELAADCDVFLTIAKLRAARLVWARLGEECGFASAARLAAQTSARMTCASDPESNIVRAGLAALAAGVGGADAITVLAFTHPLGPPDAGARRIARHTGLILALEARIGEVADAAAGAWALECLTDALCRAAWDRFTAIEAQGGMSEALRSGSLRGEIARSRAALAREIAEGRRVLVGRRRQVAQRTIPPSPGPWREPPPATRSIPPLRPVRLEAEVQR